MTDQNNAAQPGLTDDEILDAIKAGVRAARDEGLACAGPDNYVQAGALALLSKLRAEGVQAGDEREAFEAHMKEKFGGLVEPWDARRGRYGFGPDNTRWEGWHDRAALASAPVAEQEFKAAFPNGVLTSARFHELWERAGKTRNGNYTLLENLTWQVGQFGDLVAQTVGAPVAGEVRPMDWQNAQRIAELPEVDEALANFCDDSTLDNAVGLVLAVLGAAPQASDAVRNAALEEAAAFLENNRTTWLSVRAAYEIRALKTQAQADKDGGDCAKGAGDVAMRDAAFEAVRKQLCKLPRYSFFVRPKSSGGVQRVNDRSGNWIEFDAVHALFDPVSVDAALSAQSEANDE